MDIEFLIARKALDQFNEESREGPVSGQRRREIILEKIAGENQDSAIIEVVIDAMRSIHQHNQRQEKEKAS